ncbi:MAG: alginate lyase family protein [Saprospiraceae bacterium]|nr:alginate lyase family protein [Saprospiraceae bacterium]
MQDLRLLLFIINDNKQHKNFTLSTFLLYFNTLRRLKWSQFLHLLWYRLIKKHFIKFKNYNKYDQFSLHPEFVSSLVYPMEAKYRENSGFIIFHRAQRFDGCPDWSFQGYGKLWNYHLQYLEVLMDDSLASDLRMQWLLNLSQQLIQGSLKQEPYPVSMRIIYSLQFLSKYPASDPIIKTAIQTQIAYLEDNLETHLSGNHLMENYLSLVFAHMALRHPTKLNYFVNNLIKELDSQILDDGAHYELCLSYHAAIFCRLSGIIQLLRNSEYDAQRLMILEGYAGKMYTWMNSITLGFNIFPLINDSVAWPLENWMAIRKLAMEMGLDHKNLHLSDSGYRWLHNEPYQLLMRTAPFLVQHQPGHQHADYLNICLYLGTEPILIDPGISTYEGNEERLKQRGTSNHNLIVENLEDNQSEIWSAFRMGRRAKVKCIESGPEKLYSKVRWYQGHVHHRRIEKVIDGLQIWDTFESTKLKDQKGIAIFHFDGAVGEIKVDSASIHLVEKAITFHFFGAESITKQTYLQNFGFNDSRKAERIMVYFCGQLQTKISRKP